MSIITFSYRVTLIIIVMTGLSGCVSSYQPDVVQGNQIGNNQLAQIAVGMTKEEVQTILGSPLIQDMLTNNRWDYFYLKDDVSENTITHKTITLNFSNNQLTSISGDVDIAKVEAAKITPEEQSTGGTIITKPTQKKKGIFSN